LGDVVPFCLVVDAHVDVHPGLLLSNINPGEELRGGCHKQET